MAMYAITAGARKINGVKVNTFRRNEKHQNAFLFVD